MLIALCIVHLEMFMAGKKLLCRYFVVLHRRPLRTAITGFDKLADAICAWYPVGAFFTTLQYTFEHT